MQEVSPRWYDPTSSNFGLETALNIQERIFLEREASHTYMKRAQPVDEKIAEVFESTLSLRSSNVHKKGPGGDVIS